MDLATLFVLAFVALIALLALPMVLGLIIEALPLIVAALVVIWIVRAL